MSYGELSNTQETMVLPMLQMKNIRGRPDIIVSAKGMINGLSSVINDGADFGPDTTLGATSPTQTGGTYTETSGIQEGMNYANSLGGATVHLLTGTFNISTKINIPTSTSITIEGEGMGLTEITNPSTFSGSALLYATYTSGNTDNNIIIKHIDLLMAGDTVQYGLQMINTNYPTDLVENTIIDHVYTNDNASGSTACFSFSGMDIRLYNLVTSGTDGTYSVQILNAQNEGIRVENFKGYSTSQQFNVDVEAVYFINCVFANLVSTSQVVTFVGGNLYGGSSPAITILDHPTIGSGVTAYNPATNHSVSFFGAYITLLDNGSVFSDFYGTPASVEYIFDGTFFQVASGFNLLGAGNSSSTTSFANIIFRNSTIYNSSGSVIGMAPFTATPSSVATNWYFKQTGTYLYEVNIVDNTQPSITPSVPTSGTAQENTNSYAVDVYVYGGAVTEIQITRNGTAYTVFSVSTAIAMSGQAYKLNPGDSITVTYSTAPSWEWLSD